MGAVLMAAAWLVAGAKVDAVVGAVAPGAGGCMVRPVVPHAPRRAAAARATASRVLGRASREPRAGSGGIAMRASLSRRTRR